MEKQKNPAISRIKLFFGSSLEKKFLDFHIHFKVFMNKLDVIEVV